MINGHEGSTWARMGADVKAVFRASKEA